MALDRPVAEAFDELAQLALATGAQDINKLDGCWEYTIDDHWWVAINGHNESVQCSRKTDVPAFNAYIEFNGWPAGLLDPFGGTIAAGAAANEDTLIEAIRKARAALQAATEVRGE